MSDCPHSIMHAAALLCLLYSQVDNKHSRAPVVTVAVELMTYLLSPAALYSAVL